jgi:hypothetical protein
MIPRVTVYDSPSGLPIAIAQSPISTASESPSSAVASPSVSPSRRRAATSSTSSAPTRTAVDVRDADRVGVVDDVGVRQDELFTLVLDHQARAERLRRPLLRSAIERIAEETTEQRVVVEVEERVRDRDRPGDVDPDDGRSDECGRLLDRRVAGFGDRLVDGGAVRGRLFLGQRHGRADGQLSVRRSDPGERETRADREHGDQTYEP